MMSNWPIVKKWMMEVIYNLAMSGESTKDFIWKRDKKNFKR